MLQNEPNSELRTIPLYLKNPSGYGAIGVPWSTGDVKIRRHNGSWVNTMNLPVEATGGAAGSYTLQLDMTEVNTVGELFYSLTNGSIKTYVSAVIVTAGTEYFRQNEPVAALRTVPLFVVDSSGNGVSGISWSAGDLKIRKHGGTWANASALPSEATGGPPGAYVWPVSLSETDTLGELTYQVSNGSIVSLIDAVTISPLTAPAPPPEQSISWDYSDINNEILDQGSAFKTHKRLVRTISDLLSGVTGFSVSYSCDGTTAGTPGDGVNRWTSDSKINFGNETTMPGSWWVGKFANIPGGGYSSEILIQATATYSQASMVAGSGAISLTAIQKDPYDLESPFLGSVKIKVIGDSPPAGGVTFVESYPTVTIHYESGVSTPDDIASALASSTLVKIIGTGSNILNYPTDDLDYSWSNAPAGLIPGRKSGGAAFMTSSNKMIIFGGHSFFNVLLNETWAWDGTTWTQITTATTPPARAMPYMAYDSDRDKIVMFGGSNSGAMSAGYNYPATFNDTWEFDGTDWTQIFPGASPSIRYAGGMCYDTVRNEMVLFGGQDASPTNLNETWTYNGTTWTQKFPATTPTIGNLPSLAFDQANGVAVRFGGVTTVELNETWTWDGTDWTQKSPVTSPSARRQASMVYDTSRNSIAMVGGFSGSELSDIWEWTGTNWRQMFAIYQPSYPNKTSWWQSYCVYDSLRNQLVIFGGHGFGFSFNSSASDSTAKFEKNDPANDYLRMIGGVADAGNDIKLTMSRSAGFTGGTTSAVPTAADANTPIPLPLASDPGSQYVLHLVKDVSGLAWRLIINGPLPYGGINSVLFSMDKIIDARVGMSLPSVFMDIANGASFDTEFGNDTLAIWPGVPITVPGVDGLYDLTTITLWDYAVGELGHLTDIFYGAGSPSVNDGDYIIDNRGNRLVQAMKYGQLLIPWKFGTPDMITVAGSAPSPATYNGKIIAEDGDKTQYRMRAYDSTLDDIVYWSAPVLDDAGHFYTGPGPLFEVVLTNVVQGI